MKVAVEGIMYTDRVDLSGATLEGVDFSGVDFRCEEIEWYTSDGRVTMACPAEFRGAQLRRVDFTGCTFHASDFRGAHIERVSFAGAAFRTEYEANRRAVPPSFGGASLRNSDFARSELAGSCFSDAEILNCSFKGADLQRVSCDNALIVGADLSHADIRGALFADCRVQDLRLYATRVNSSDDAALRVLEQAVPDLVYLDADVRGQALAFGSRADLEEFARGRLGGSARGVFLSHTHRDKEFARKLGTDLHRHGVRVWIDEAEIKVGDSLIEKIREGIDAMDFLAVVLSTASIESPWVRREVDVAMNAEIEGKQIKVLPVLLEQCPLPGFLRGKLYADFTAPSKYSKGLQLLLDRLLD